MKIAIILGSVRKGRHTHRTAYYLKQKLSDRDIATDLIDLAEQPLPILEKRAGQHEKPPEHLGDISSRLDRADALLLITPEYHGSISGVLKNALDYFWSELQKKPIGTVTTSAGKFGGINASSHLQEIILSIGAFPMPVKWLVPQVHRSFDDNNQPKHDGVAESAKKFLDEFLWFADALYQKKLDDSKISEQCEEAA